MPMGEEDQEFLKAEGIHIHDGWGQTEVVTKDGKVAGIKFRKCLSVKNAEGRFDPKFDDNETTEQKCSTILFSIGQKPDYGKLFEGTKVELSPRGMIIADPVTLQTAEPDIFAGGDSVSGQKFVVDALAMGREGAVSLHRFVNNGQHLMIHRNTRNFEMLNKDEIVLPAESYKKPARQIREIDEAKKLTMSYEIKQFTEEQIKKEAERCLKCGRSVVDQNKCIGCGMCTVQCKFDAIHLIRRPDGDLYSRMIPAEQKFIGIGKNMPVRIAGIVKNKIANR
jgi:ferredoxin